MSVVGHKLGGRLPGVRRTGASVFTFERPGDYKYFCAQHNTMTERASWVERASRSFHPPKGALMTRMNSRTLRLLAAMLTVAVLGVACGGKEEAAPTEPPTQTTEAPVPTGPDTVAARLRSSLDGLLQEHVALTAAATGASVGGRGDEFTAASAALDANSNALTATIGSVFGSDAGTTFGPLWKKHVQLFISYSQGQQQAVNELTAYTKDFGAFINSVLPDLPADAVAELMTQHVVSMKDVIDAQRARNEAKAYTNLRTAMANMSPIAQALTAATSAKFPEKVSGNPTSPAATLLVTLDTTLREHVFLLTAATGAALGGRQEELTAASTALDANSNALTAAIASVYGPEAGKAFDPLWKRHIGLFMEYATAVAAKDKAKGDKAIQDLLAYTVAFGSFINSASPALGTEAVGELLKTHVLTVKDAIDAQGAKNYAAAYHAIRIAAEHMSTITEPLAGAIVKQFAQKF
jgi:hypothetical protein